MPRCLKNRGVVEAYVGSTPSARVLEGRNRLHECLHQRPDLVGHTVKETPGDGLCFLHAVLQQLRINPGHIWKVATLVIRHMLAHVADWRAYAVGDDLLHERLSNLRKHNILQYLD